MNELTEKYPEEIQKILAKYPPDRCRSAVMPLLFMSQRLEGFISPQAIQDIAELTSISTTEVNTVVGFYTLFHTEPGGRYRLQVCTDVTCAMNGAEQFLEELCTFLGISPGMTTPDGLFSVEEVKCLAGCHRAPLFQVQGDGRIVYHEHQSLETARQWIESIQREQSRKGAD